jgi:hypothetical protein
MTGLIEYFKRNKLISASLVLLVVGIVVLTILFFWKSAQVEEKKPDKLNATEQKYPEAPAQPFLSNDPDTGTLIVTSKIKDIRIMIDAPEEEVATASAELPINVNPFKISSIPVGDHNVFAFKEGYELYEKDFIVEKNKITRLEINLIPLEKAVGQGSRSWINKLPLQDQYYYVEYNQEADNIIATLSPPPAVQTTKAIQIDFLKKMVIDDLKNIGVDTDKERIVWIER